MNTDDKNNIHERSTVVVDLEAIRHNLREFKALQMKHRSKPMLIFSSVKANAYGHGSIPVARAIAGITDYYGVACIDEAVELRKNGIEGPVLVLGAALSDDFEAALKYDVTLTVFDFDRAAQLDACAGKLNKTAKIHIAVDTGMSRIGLRPDRSGAETIGRIAALENIEITGIFTHFATADEADKAPVNEAHERFLAFKHLCESEGINIPIWHCANTAANIEGIGLEDEMDMSRCGVGIYGIYPSDEVSKENIELIPALKWFSCLTLVKEIKKGTSVSYGYNFTADKDMLIGTVACGYADGFLRILSPKGAELIIRGKRCPVIGNVCMDQMMVDLSEVPDAKAGDRVVIIGAAEDSFAGNEDNKPKADEETYCNPVTADELGALADTISYEIICGLAARTKRRYINV